MGLVLLNLQTDQQIELDNENPVIIGRKNVSECHDKRVSRRHGKVTWKSDGKIVLVALHSNPCFFTRNGVPPVLQLNKNEEEILREGDCFGLLPDSFWFQITNKVNCKASSEKKLPMSREKIEEPIAEDSETVDVKNFDETVTEIDVKESNGTSSSETARRENELISETLGGYGTPEFEKTRRLPLWMYEIDEPAKSETSPCQKNSSPTDSKPEVKKIKVESEAGPCDNLDSTKGKDCIKEDPDSNTSLKKSDHSSGEKSPTKDFEHGDDSEKQHESYESDFYTEDEEIDSSKRPICQYEDKCYRKNPQHKLEFCHPGDADYVPYENRPVCSHESSCYRINKTHRTEFWHPPDKNQASPPSCTRTSSGLSPIPDKRKRQAVKREGVEFVKEEDCDSEDPFAGDASSDEFIPGASDADGDTDVVDDDD